MKNHSFGNALKAFFLVAAFVFTLSARSQTANSVNMAYKFQPDRTYKYFSDSKAVQSIDAGGQVMDINVSVVMGCSIKSTGTKNGNLTIEVKIDTMAQTIDSPQGGAGGDISSARGKSFPITISPQGKELDLSEAQKVVISVPGGGDSDASQSFNDFFPDLPSGSVAPGHKWPTTDTLITKSVSGSMNIIVKAANTFDGFEEVNGKKCAKISSTLEGTRSVTSQTQGMDIYMSGPFTGTATVWFSPEEGTFIKQVVKTRVNGNVQISGPQEMTFPMIMDQTTTNELRK